MRRAVLLLSSLLLGAYSLSALVGVATTDRSDPIQREGSGLVLIIGTCTGWMAVALLRAGLRRAFPSAIGLLALRSFAYGWLLGVVVDIVVSQLNMARPERPSMADVALDVFSIAVVGLTVSIPALLALVIVRGLER